MTLPDERYRAVIWAEQFLIEVGSNRKKYPRVPVAVRREAMSILRHYPGKWDMKRAAQSAPDVFQEQIEPVTRMLMVYEQERSDDDAS